MFLYYSTLSWFIFAKKKPYLFGKINVIDYHSTEIDEKNGEKTSEGCSLV